MRKVIIFIVLGLVALTSPAFGQGEANRTHQVGDFWRNVAGDGFVWVESGDHAWWPGGLNETRTNPDIRYGMFAGFGTILAVSDWKAPTPYPAWPREAGKLEPKWVSEDGTVYGNNIVETVDINPHTTGRPRKFFRLQPPKITVDGQDIPRTEWKVFPEQGDEVRPTLTADEMIEAVYVQSIGVTVRAQSYAYANDGYDDFHILVYTFTNEGRLPEKERTAPVSPQLSGQTLKDFYAVFDVKMEAGGRGGGGVNTQTRFSTAGLDLGNWDNLIDYDDKEKLLMSWDGDHVTVKGYRADNDDQGDPAPGPGTDLDKVQEALVSPGEFLDSAYRGLGALHVDRTPTKNKDQLTQNWLDAAPDEQPHSARWVDAPEWKDVLSAPHALSHDFHVQPGTTRAQRIGKWDGGRQQRSMERLASLNFGPWNVGPGESVHVVLMIGANGPSIDANKVYGAFYLRGKWLAKNELPADPTGALAPAYDRIARTLPAAKLGTPFTKADKDAFIDSGRDSLQTSVRRAREVWKAGVAAGSMAPKLPPVPPWPAAFTIKSGPDQNDLSWAAATGAAKYRIYRTVGFETRPREAVAEATGTSYTDKTVSRGAKYFYAVTAVDSKGLESSYYATRAEGGRGGVSPFRSPARSITDVRVVPNPYQIEGGELNPKSPTAGGFNFPGQPHKLLFVNLPARATIRIFTLTGDLVNQIEHTSGSGDEEWRLMVSDNNQFLVSGIYLAHIQSHDPGVPGSHIVKFIVVR